MKKLPTWVEIDLDKLSRNLRLIEEHTGEGVGILLTVKADAYGHGAVQVAAAASDRVRGFGVATLDEARELLRAGIEPSRVLILSPVLLGEIPGVIDGGFSITVPSGGFAAVLSDAARARGEVVEVHIEVDTGMGRAGIDLEECEEEIKRIHSLDGIEVVGIFTHFPSSDTDPLFTRWQIERFLGIVDRLAAEGIRPEVIHSANSSALAKLRESHMEMVRPGLLAYGYLPEGGPGGEGVSPVLSWKCRIVQIRKLPPGRTVSYGRTFETKRETVMGIVPVGYGHGYPHRLSGSGSMLVRGRRVPILGRITMDMTMIDLTDLDEVPHVGEEVVLLGEQNGERITPHELARLAGTIAYEILCGISKRVPRVYLRDGKVETFKSLLGIVAGRVRA